MMKKRKYKRKRGVKPAWQKQIARERIEILLNEAKKAAKQRKFDFANRYAKLAKLIGMRYTVRLKPEQKRKICKYCDSFLLPGVTCDVKIDTKNHKIKIICGFCKKIIRLPYKPRKKDKK
jgi:ribonuclease P protein subunit RPR2